MNFADLAILGIAAHCVADWMLQNDWMAVNKVRPLESPANAIHSGIHFLCLWCVFPFWVAFALGWIHGIVDTRTPLVWLRRQLGQAKDGNPVAVHVAIWHDQVVHLLCIIAAAWYVSN